MNTNDIDIEQLLPLYLEGKADGRQRQAVDAWLGASESHRQIASDMAGIYAHVDEIYIAAHVDTEKALSSVNGRIRGRKIGHLVRSLERIAAVLFIPLLIVAILETYSSLHKSPARLMTFSTSPGMVGSMTLPDGSRVSLNSNSTLSYPAEFTGDNRQVALSGEAYFAVAKDRRHPFIVSTPCHASVHVYGTHFNVEAYGKDDHMTATLEEGSIALGYEKNDGTQGERRIKPGQTITYSARTGRINVSTTDVGVATSWKDGHLIFRNTPLRDVLHSLSKRYGVEFIAKNQQVYRSSFTGTLDHQRLDQILEILSISSGIQFKYLQGNNINEDTKIEIY